MLFVCVGVFAAVWKKRPRSYPPVAGTLADARRGFATNLTRHDSEGDPPADPPAELFRLVTYRSPAGELSAYVSTPPGDGKKHPAILWLIGGFSNSIWDIAWNPGPPENDQSASVFRQAGIVMMYPSLRGGNDNPGLKECFFGEVDDVLAAADFLAQQEHVDPRRIYLGGHSTGGTLALLAAEAAPNADRFRAIFAFGPIDDVEGYGRTYLPFDRSNPKEFQLRAPILWLSNIRTPTFVFEGDRGNSNIDPLRAMADASTNPLIHFYPVEGGDHRTILQPLSRMIAEKILRDVGDAPGTTSAPSRISITEAEVAGAMAGR